MLANDYKFTLRMPYQGKNRGDEVSLMEIAGENGTWTFERKNRRTGDAFSALVVKHYVVQIIRRLAGLKIVKEPTLIVSPTIENGMTAAFAGAMQLPNKHNKPDLIIGEANKSNTQIDYIVSMAYKRWYDRAVLDCLEWNEAYSDIESEAFDENQPAERELQLTDLKDVEVKVIMPFVQAINDAKDATSLTLVGGSLKAQLEAAKASPEAVKVLRGIYDRRNKELNGKQF